MNEETIFDEAIGKRPGERATYLDEACGGDAELRERIEILLHSHDEAGTFLAHSAAEDLDATLDISVDDQALIAARSAALRASVLEKEKPEDHEPPSVSIVVEPDGKRVMYFGDYELQGEIARGAMGVVYRAEQKSLKRTVAIKMIRSTLLTNEVDVARFQAEAEAAASLDHPNIVPIYEVGMHKEQHYFTMKLIEGGTLRNHLERLKKDPKAAAKLMATVAGAIHTAHQRGILHRDLKPGNILVDEAGEPHVTDFGLAKQMESNNSVTLSGQIMGTPQYMSPEQAEGGGRTLTTAADVYALGAILYEILCGEPPHRGDSLMETLRLVAQEEPVPPGKRAEKVDRDLETIAMKCVEKDPAKRYSSAQGLKNDLDRWLRGEPIEARPVGTMEKVGKWMKRKPMHAAAAGLGLLFLLTLGIGGPVVAIKQATLKKESEASEAIAIEERESARKALGRSAISVAEVALREGNGPAMRASLNDVPENLRDSTWRYLFGQSDTSIAVLDAGAHIVGVAAHPRLRGVFVVVDVNGLVSILNVLGGEPLLQFPADFSEKERSYSFDVAISSDGERIAVGRAPAGDLVIHDGRNGEKLLEWDAPQTRALVFSPDNRWLFQAPVGRETFYLYDARTGERKWSKYPEKTVTSAVFTPDGENVLVNGFGKSSTLLSVKDGSATPVDLKYEARVSAINPNGKLVVSGDMYGTIRGVELADGRVMYEFRTDDQPIQAIFFTADGTRFVTMSVLGDGREAIRIWDAQTGAPIHSLLGGQDDIKDASVHPLSGELIVCGDAARVWSLDGARWSLQGNRHAMVAFWGADDVVFAPALQSNGSLVQLQNDVPAVLWNASLDENFKFQTDGSNRPDTSGNSFLSDVSADGRLSVIGVNYTNSFLLLQRNGREVGKVTRFMGDEKAIIRQLRLSSTGTAVATIQNNEYEVVVFDLSTKTQRSMLSPREWAKFRAIGWLGDTELVGLVALRPERGTEGSEHGIVRWNAATGEILQQAMNSGTMNAIAVSPDGSRFAEGGADKHVRIRDAVTLAVLQEFRAHNGPVTALAWHPRKPILATGSADRTISLWDLETGERIDERRGPLASPHTLAFAPGGQRLGCASLDGTTRIWDLPCLRDESAPPSDGGSEEADSYTWFSDPTSYRPPEWMQALNGAGIETSAFRKRDGSWVVAVQSKDFSDCSVFAGAGDLRGLILDGTAVADLGPLRGLNLAALSLEGTPVVDLSPLQAIPLVELNLGGTGITDLSPLQGKPLTQLLLHGCKELTDLSPIEETKALRKVTLPPNAADVEFLRTFPTIERLSFGLNGSSPDKSAAEFWEAYDRLAWTRALRKSGGKVMSINAMPDGTWDVSLSGMKQGDLETLRGVPISRLKIWATSINDLSPLKGMPLKILHAIDVKATDLSALRGMPLTHLRLYGCTELVDLSPLAEAKELVEFALPPNAKDIEFLRSFPNLKRLSFRGDPKKKFRPDMTFEEFWKDYDESAWLRNLRELDIEIETLERTPAGTWDVSLRGVSTSDLEVLRGAPVGNLVIHSAGVTDLEPLRGMALKSLTLRESQVTDLSPLEGMPLQILYATNSNVADVSVLRGMPLTHLRLNGCAQITDLSPLAEARGLIEFGLPPNAKDFEFLRSFPKLKRMSFRGDLNNDFRPDLTAEEFWKEHDAGRE